MTELEKFMNKMQKLKDDNAKLKERVKTLERSNANLKNKVENDTIRQRYKNLAEKSRVLHQRDFSQRRQHSETIARKDKAIFELKELIIKVCKDELLSETIDEIKKIYNN